MTGADAGLSFWARAVGLALWCPAFALPGAPVPLQPLDLLAPFGALLALMRLRRVPALLFPVLASAALSIGLSWGLVGGVPLILAWTLGFAIPFIFGMGIVAQASGARQAFLGGFLVGALLSAALFAAQVFLDAEALDFRTNIAFRLPAQYGRGFALMPEVSTYAVHAILAASIGLVLVLHPATGANRRVRAGLVIAATGATLALTQSTSVFVLLPGLAMLAFVLTTRASFNTGLLALIGLVALSILLIAYIDGSYQARLENASAERSGSMRLSSILGGISVLWRGEIFGVGIGNNAEIAGYAYDMARTLGLDFGALPDGVNAQIIGRVFEEGWGAVVHFAIAATCLLAALKRWRDPTACALAVLAWGSALSALGILGYRGLYTAWLWLAIPAGLLSEGRHPSAGRR